MKKNKIMRIACCLVVAVLLSTCAISGTFAKYTTSADAGDTARVAKFGVTLTATGDTAFADAYKDKAETSADLQTVVTSGAAGDALVAPGTNGDLGSFKVEGKPEVDVKIDYEIKFELGDKWVGDATSAYYCPLEITVNGTVIKGTAQASAEAFEIAVEDAIAAALGMTALNNGSGVYTKNVDSNTDLAAEVTVTWAWAYEGNDDVKDTYLGDQAALNNAATVEFSIKGTVTQID